MDIFKWVTIRVEPDEESALQICQNMLNEGYISRVDGRTHFDIGDSSFYQFYEDREDLPDNMLKPWKGPVSNALEVSAELVKIVEELYKEAIIEVEYSTKIVAEKALKSKVYEIYMTEVSKLALVELNFYSQQEIYCFFLNVYQ